MICRSPLSVPQDISATCTTRKPLFHDLYGSYGSYESCQAIHGSYLFDSIGQACPMRTRFQSDMSADSEKICDRFIDFPASGPMLQPKHAYPYAKWRTLKSKPGRKKRSFDEKEINLLTCISRNIPAILTKLIPTTKTNTNGTLHAPICFRISRGRQISTTNRSV